MRSTDEELVNAGIMLIGDDLKDSLVSSSFLLPGGPSGSPLSRKLATIMDLRFFPARRLETSHQVSRALPSE
jgi:hypothetical protein